MRFGWRSAKSELACRNSIDSHLLQDREQLQANDCMVRKVLEALEEEGVETASKEGMCDPRAALCMLPEQLVL